MTAICITHPDAPDDVMMVPPPRPPWTFEEVYGSAGYTLVPNCPPLPEESRGSALEPAELPAKLRTLVDEARNDGKLDDSGDDSHKEIRE